MLHHVHQPLHTLWATQVNCTACDCVERIDSHFSADLTQHSYAQTTTRKGAEQVGWDQVWHRVQQMQ